MVSLVYYDLVLVAIAMSLGMGALVGVLTSVAMTVAVPLFALVAVALVGHALFVNGPVDDVEDLSEEVEPQEVPGVETVVQVAE